MESVDENGWNPLRMFSGKKIENRSGDTKTLSGLNLSEATPEQVVDGRSQRIAGKLMEQIYRSLYHRWLSGSQETVHA